MEEANELLLLLNIVVVCYAAVLVTLDVTARRKQRNRKKSIWIRDILRRRNEEGTHSILLPKLLSDDIHYRNFLRMSKENFAFLLAKVEPSLVRSDTVWHRKFCNRKAKSGRRHWTEWDRKPLPGEREAVLEFPGDHGGIEPLKKFQLPYLRMKLLTTTFFNPPIFLCNPR